MQMPDLPEERWVSISEAARLLGVSRQAVDHRIKRGTLRTRANNRGQKLVQIPATVEVTVEASNPSTTVAPPEPRHPASDAPETMPLSVHRETIEAIQRASGESLAALQTAMDRQERQHQAEVDRLQKMADRRFEQMMFSHEDEVAKLRAEHVRECRANRWQASLLAILVVAVLYIFFPIVVK